MDEKARAEAEARNGLLQFDLARDMIVDAIDKGEKWKLRPSMLLSLHREALQGISIYAGNFRPAEVSIEGSKHKPVGAFQVPGLLRICAIMSTTTGPKRQPCILRRS
ncbi:hypothetical protein Kim5_PD00083 (plasmid) [Rhizobium sp. Kim5]|nr:hypothetical protein Kim5_PD00083 [Rhizobium sp. Kim5]